ncbi:unnamed protein product, partial [Coregonus sp. 'balchen']
MTQDDILTPKPPRLPDQRANSSTTSLKKRWHILSTDPQLEKTSKETKRDVFRRGPNISQMVVRSDLPRQPFSTFLDNVPDGNYRCGQCNFTNKCTTFNHPITGKAIKIQRNPVAGHFIESRHNISSLRYI